MTTTMQPLTLDHLSVSQVIRAYMDSFSVLWGDEQRHASRLLGTATGPADEEARAWIAIDWLVRVHTPAFLRVTGLEDHARALESLAQIVDPPSARAALNALGEAHEAAFPDAAAGLANDEARLAAWAAARDSRDITTWAAAAPWDAWRAAAWIAARVAARTAAAGGALQASAIALLDAMLAVPVRGVEYR